MNLGQLEGRIQRLEDIEAIRRVRGEYALAADERSGCAVNVERTMELFSPEGVWDGRPRWGRHEGRENVRKYLSTGGAGIDWSLHWLLDTGIGIDENGDTASARWYLVEIARMLDRSTSRMSYRWLFGFYDDHYVKLGGCWKFKNVRFDCQRIGNASSCGDQSAP